MPIENNSLPWWLGPSKAPWEAMLEGVQAGSQIRSNQIRTKQVIAEEVQNIQRQETAAALKMLEIRMEQERNSLAVKSFQSKQEADLMKAKGMAEIGDYLGQATREGKLTDPEAQAGFWRITSKYAPFISEQAVNSMWDNTFKAAADRKYRAENITSDDPANVKSLKYAKSLEAEADAIDELGFTEQATKLRGEAESIKSSGRLYDRNQPLEVEQIIGEGGRVHEAVRLPNGTLKFLPYFDDSKISPIDRDTYKSELSDLQRMWRDMEIIGADKKPDAEKYARMKKDLYDRFVKKKGNEKSPAGEKPFDFDFDPKTRSLNPIK